MGVGAEDRNFSTVFDAHGLDSGLTRVSDLKIYLASRGIIKGRRKTVGRDYALFTHQPVSRDSLAFISDIVLRN